MPLDFAADPVFGQFAPWSGAAKAGFHAGYLGEMTDARFIEPGGRLFHKIGANADAGRDRHEAGSYPPVREEIIEWHALLSAVLASRERFVMVDCGAGFGRWLVCAAQALRRAGAAPVVAALPPSRGRGRADAFRLDGTAFAQQRDRSG
jgi:hypothetical protein